MSDTLLPFDGGGDEPVSAFAGVVDVVTLTVTATSLEVGTTATATALVEDALSDALAGRTVTWASTDAAKIAAPASGTTGSDGKVVVPLTALVAGTTTITATCETVNSSGAAMTVTAVAAQPGYSTTGSVRIIINCVSMIKRMGRARPRRFSDADQRKIDPTDTAFSRVVDGAEKEIVWPNRELMRRYT